MASLPAVAAPPPALDLTASDRLEALSEEELESLSAALPALEKLCR